MFIQKPISLLLMLCWLVAKGNSAPHFSKYDYLHGKLSGLRKCYDVSYYDIKVRVMPEKKEITGYNNITFEVIKDFNKLQLDFSAKMMIDSIVFNHIRCKYERDSNTIYATIPYQLHKGSKEQISIYFSGKPHEAKKAPWDGGFVWAKDSSDNPWVGMACEGIGPQIWLPCKDHWSDEADSMNMQLVVPENLIGVSNGKLVKVTDEIKGYKNYEWHVVNPINTYSISINVGDFACIKDSIYSMTSLDKQALQLTYYVLKANKEKAQIHFSQVQNMLNCYERYFGSYPFWEDGYKLVENPYWGMEHQSCIAYGNNYQNNKFGFDFIIIHESAHEWFANSITAADPADMWIHESFTTYAEALYVEYTRGYQASVKYLEGQKGNIKSGYPMVGPNGVYFHGRTDNDIYYKGTWILHTMRGVIDNDSMWFAALKGFYNRYEKKIISTKDVIDYFNSATKMNWNHFFKQYLYLSI